MFKHRAQILRFKPHTSPQSSYRSNYKHYATISDGSHDTQTDLFHWPKIQYPTPYEIFRISKSSEIDKKVLKQYFHQLAKIYHPDSLLSKSTLSATDTSAFSNLTPQLREERFKLIVTAYNILKDDSKRRDFDLYNKGWDTSKRPSTNYYGRDFTKCTKFKTKYANDTSDPWASYHSEYRNHMRNQDPEYQRQQWEKHKKMVYILALGSFGIAALQFIYVFHFAEADIAERNKHSQKAYHNVYLALTNYGFGYGKKDRIDRFLAHREDSLYNNMDEKDAHFQKINPFSLMNMVPAKAEDNTESTQSLPSTDDKLAGDARG